MPCGRESPRSLVIFHAWSGPAHLAREHGERALTLARTAGDAHTAFWAYWGLAVSAAMSGKAQAVDQYIRHGAAISDQLGAPLLKAWLTELIAELHYAPASGTRGLRPWRRALAVSRAISNTALTVRLLVLASMFYWSVETSHVDAGTSTRPGRSPSRPPPAPRRRRTSS